MKLTIDGTSVGMLLEQAEPVTELVGRMDDANAARADDVDAVVDDPTEVLSVSWAVAAPDAFTSHHRESADGAPMLTSRVRSAR